FVGDALAGNDIINQAKSFDENVGFDSIILCKIDADSKGGAAISLSFELKKPIIYLGTGQDYKDLIKFDPKFILEKIFNNI
ncbi:MAG: signal recognition particle-docking protein FtsY, partial [Thermoplasmata archaeon]